MPEDLEVDVCTDREVLDAGSEGGGSSSCARAAELVLAQQQLLDLQQQAHHGLARLRQLKAATDGGEHSVPAAPAACHCGEENAAAVAPSRTNKNGFRMRITAPASAMEAPEPPMAELTALKSRAAEALAALADITSAINAQSQQRQQQQGGGEDAHAAKIVAAVSTVDAAAAALDPPPPRSLVESVLLSEAFLMRCHWRAIGTLGTVCRGWSRQLFQPEEDGGGMAEQTERVWQCVCLSIGASESLYVPPAYTKSWKRMFFDLLYPARQMWASSSSAATASAPGAPERSYQIQVLARFRPGDAGSDDDQLLLPLRQRLKLRKKGDKIASEHFGLPVRAVRELLEAGVLEAGAELPPQIVQALADAASLDQAAEQSVLAAMRDSQQHPGNQDVSDDEAARGEGATAAVLMDAGAVAGGQPQGDDLSGRVDSTRDDTELSDTAAAAQIPVAVHQRRHGSARLLTVQPAKAVLFIPGQGFRPFLMPCFGGGTSQQQIYDASARDAVCSVLNGFNSCLFVYGQTGSGKTHTLFGPDTLLTSATTATKAAKGEVPRDAGVVLRAMHELIQQAAATATATNDQPSSSSSSQHAAVDTAEAAYDHCANAAAGRARVSLSASYVEIYQEAVTDLLSGAPVQVREGSLVGASSRTLRCVADALELLREGEARKSRAATAMNERSSRAHTMVLVRITQAREPLQEGLGSSSSSAGGGTVVVHSELALVDLAGCEQLKQSRAEGQQKQEATAINSSLMVLRKCISALVEDKRHVPFYESKLTMLLRPALSGNARTTAVICGAPEPSNAEQTLAALRFGEDCGTIATKATLQGVSSLSGALGTIHEALAQAKSDLAALAARGKQHLPAYQKLQEKFNILTAKRQELRSVRSHFEQVISSSPKCDVTGSS